MCINVAISLRRQLEPERISLTAQSAHFTKAKRQYSLDQRLHRAIVVSKTVGTPNRMVPGIKGTVIKGICYAALVSKVEEQVDRIYSNST